MSTVTITKSIRLSPEESAELLQLSKLCAASESALMKQWIQQGIEAKKLELALQAYMKRETDLRGGAAMAGVSFNRFMREVQAHNIIILEDEGFLDGLAFLAEAFHDQKLGEAVKAVRAEANAHPIQSEKTPLQ